MADEWFEIAELDHFWIARRFDVLRSLLETAHSNPSKVGEVGCGNGLVQQQFYNAYGIEVAGFDLNVNGLEASRAPQQPRYCYNVYDRHPSFKEQFDLMFLFDVVEHIENDEAFMEAVLYHVKPGGLVAINVPAMPTLFSDYDRRVGHVRRYTVPSLRRLGERCSLKTETITYWGMPLVPLLYLRTLRLAAVRDPEKIVDVGFRPPGAAANRMLKVLSALEIVPQSIAGTSVMGLFRKPGGDVPPLPHV
jgi:SAM-dependent methyltransferase